MRIPKEIVGKNRIRDFEICRLYIDGMSTEEIRDLLRRRRRPISTRRIQAILSNNALFINPRIGWDKTKRMHKLIRMMNRAGDGLAERRDALDILKEMRIEAEGEKSPEQNQSLIVQIHEQAKKALKAKEEGRFEGRPRVV